ncbi:MAG: hypothetical protein EOP50_10645, partial [Sphingobacteriales bacterium]
MFAQHKLFLLTSLIAGSLAAVAQPRAVPAPYSATATDLRTSYVRTIEPQQPIKSVPAVHFGLGANEARIATQYTDGLGRPLQTVVKQGSLVSSGQPTDLVSPVEYDAYGRVSFSYAPYAATSNTVDVGNDGSFKKDAFGQQATFMQAQFGSQGQSYFYSAVQYEASPLDRVTKSMPIGDSWVGAGRGSSVKYCLNVADEVHRWTITEGGTGGYGNNTTSTTSKAAATPTNPSGFYEPGELSKTITENESGAQVIEYKDKQGHVVLKKVQLTAAADNGTGSPHTGWLCTYYLYCNYGHLHCVIQPRGVELLDTPGGSTSGLWTLSSVLLDEQCFRYEYDGRYRLIMKKVPGAVTQGLVYDKRDRLVMVQDGNLSDATK